MKQEIILEGYYCFLIKKSEQCGESCKIMYGILCKFLCNMTKTIIHIYCLLMLVFSRMSLHAFLLFFNVGYSTMHSIIKFLFIFTFIQ